MGQRGRDCWQEIWPIIWPQIDDVMSRRRSSWNEDEPGAGVSATGTSRRSTGRTAIHPSSTTEVAWGASWSSAPEDDLQGGRRQAESAHDAFFLAERTALTTDPHRDAGRRRSRHAGRAPRRSVRAQSLPLRRQVARASGSFGPRRAHRSGDGRRHRAGRDWDLPFGDRGAARGGGPLATVRVGSPVVSGRSPLRRCSSFRSPASGRKSSTDIIVAIREFEPAIAVCSERLSAIRT